VPEGRAQRGMPYLARSSANTSSAGLLSLRTFRFYCDKAREQLDYVADGGLHRDMFAKTPRRCPSKFNATISVGASEVE
jgi:hypothetical protein